MRSYFRDILNSILTPVASAGLIGLAFTAGLIALWAIMCLVRLLLE